MTTVKTTMAVANERFMSKSAGPSLFLIEALYSTFSGVHMPAELNSLAQHARFGIDPNQESCHPTLHGRA
jgi:hypothetical protein